jgi:hypothetical protein
MIGVYIFGRMFVWFMVVIVMLTALFIYICALAGIGFFWLLCTCWAAVHHRPAPVPPRPGHWTPRNARMYHSDRR